MIIKNLFYFFVGLIFIFPIAARADAETVRKVLPKFEKTIKTVMETWQQPGLAVAVVSDGEVVFEKGFGVRSLTSQDKITTHTVFQIASLSKTFTATLMGILADQRMISLNDPLRKYLPNLVLGSDEQTQQIKLWHILSHTTGFVGHAGDPKIEGGETYQSVLASFEILKILYAPGLVHDYQNVLYSLVGDVVEKVAKKSFADEMKQLVFIPLGMTDASLGWEDLQNTFDKALPYVYRNKEQKPVPYSTRYYATLPAAGINASIDDMAKWLLFQMEDNPPLMSQSMLKKLHTQVISSPSENARMRPFRERVSRTWYGLGFRIYDYAGHVMITHGGMLNGFKSMLAYLPEERVGLVMLTNSTSPAIGILRTTFFDSVLGLNPIDWNTQFKEKENAMPVKKVVKKRSVKKKPVVKKRK